MTLLLTLPAILIVILIGFVPVFKAFLDASIVDGLLSVSNFQYIIQDNGFFFSLKISILWAFLNTIIILCLGLLIAHFLNEMKRWKTLYLALLVPWGIPLYIGVPIWRSIIHRGSGFSPLNLIGLDINMLTDPMSAFLSALFVSVWFGLPITVFVLWGAMATIPKGLTDSVKLDGGTNTTLLFNLYLPTLKPTLVTMFVLNFLKFMKEFSVVFLMTDGGPPLVSGFTKRSIIGATTTLDIFIYDIFMGRNETGIVSAYSVLTLLVVAFMMVLWFLSSREKPNLIFLITITLVAHLAVGGCSGLIIGPLYLLTFYRRGCFAPVLLADIATNLITVLSLGFLKGLNPATIVSFLVFLIIRKQAGSQRVFRGSERAFKIMKYLLISGVIIAALLPLVHLLWISLSAVSTTFIDSPLPKFLTLGNFKRVMKEERILRVFFNTLLVSALTGILTPLLTFHLASFLRKHRGTFSDLMIVLLNMAGVIGGMHTLVPLYNLFNSIGMIDSYFPIILIYSAHAIPFSVFTIRTYLSTIPASLEDQARIDGLGSVGYNYRILLPLSKPVLTTSFIVAFLGAWNGFLVPLLFIFSDSKYTIGVKLYSYVGSLGSGYTQWNLFGAAAVINLLIMGLVFYTFREHLGKTPLSEHFE